MLNLVNMFFDNFGLLFPYIYKRSIVDELHRLQAARFNGVRRSWLCLLNIIMAFAVRLSSDPELSKETGEADAYLKRALILLPNLTFRPANLEICKTENLLFLSTILTAR